MENERKYVIRVLTPLHVGAGEGLGHIDLPICREAHTGFPSIPSTAIKGPIRAREILNIARSLEKDTEEELRKFAEEILDIKNVNELGKASLVEKILENIKEEDLSKAKDSIRNILSKIEDLAQKFGSKDKEGYLTFIDARILFFPVKSFKGIFSLITCPYVLKRFKEDTEIDLFKDSLKFKRRHGGRIKEICGGDT